ncbi:MAG: PAS domain-containing protein [Planctomycetota bacterium]
MTIESSVDPFWRPSLPTLVRAVFVGVAYFLGAELGHWLSLPGNFATVWPSAGIAMSALALHATHKWPALLVAIVIGNLASDIGFHDKSLVVSTGFCMANVLESILAAIILRGFVFRHSHTSSTTRQLGISRLPPPSLDALPRLVLGHWSAVAVFIVGSCTVSTGFGAIIGSLIVTRSYGGDFVDTLRMWWGGDAVGMLIVGSLVFGLNASITDWQRGKRDSLTHVRWTVFLLITLFGLSIGIFGYQSNPIVYTVMPILVLLSLQARQARSIIGLAIVALVATYFTSRASGPFSLTDSIAMRATLLQLYLMVLTTTVLFFQAILQEKNVREETQQQELTTILNSLDTLVFMKDTKNYVLRCNEAAARSLSKTPDQVAGRHASELYPEQFRKFERDERDIIASGKAKRHYEESLTLPDGTTMHVETSKIPFRNKLGQVSGLITVVNDITQLKRSSEFVEKLFNLAPVPQLLFADQGVIECNQAALELFGMEEKEDLLHRVPVQFSPLHQPCGTSSERLGNQYLHTAFKDGACDFDWTHQRDDNTQFIAKVSMRRVWWESGVALLVSLNDVSQQKRYESQLRDANRQLESSNDELRQFANIASHDLKAPLRAIGLLTDFVIQDCGETLPSESREHLQLIQGRTNRMGHLLDDLLAYSRVGKTHGAIRKIDSREALLETVEFCEIPNEVNVQVNGVGVVFITLDIPLKTCLRNLVSNAVKHRRQGDGRIELCSQDDGSHILFSIVDDGHGIPHEYQQRVYRMFETLRARDDVEGSGMGLALVKKAVDTYGGAIDFESPNPHQGTTFQLRWPKVIAIRK